ncbi:hypothetical protein QQX98_001398, partial [Neonectria punicea]
PAVENKGPNREIFPVATSLSPNPGLATWLINVAISNDPAFPIRCNTTSIKSTKRRSERVEETAQSTLRLVVEQNVPSDVVKSFVVIVIEGASCRLSEG